VNGEDFGVGSGSISSAGRACAEADVCAMMVQL